MQERSFVGDEQIAWIEGQQNLTQPTFLCPSQNKISFLCLNTSCKQALHCSDEDCMECFIKHENCGKSHYISSLTKKLNTLIDTRRQVIAAVDEIDKQFQREITKDYQEFVSKYPNFNLGPELSEIVRNIYRSEKGVKLNGVQADQLCAVVSERAKNIQERVKEQLKQYEQNIWELSQQVRRLKKNLRESLTQYKIQLPGSEIKHHQKDFGKKQDFKGFDSAILKLPNDDEKIEFLFKSLAEVGPIESLQLLFRGSKDGFKASTFHEKCDNIHDTVVIVRTDGETNNTVAGYSHYRWNEAKGYVHDAGKKAFLLQLNRREKYVPQNENSLIYCHNGYGPTFGYGSDLCISNDCNSNNYSHSYFPHTYNFQGPNKIVENQQSYTSFSGATNGSSFRVIDYEVFRVVFK